MESESANSLIETGVEGLERRRNAMGKRTVRECFHSIFQFSQTFTENMFSISFREHRDEKKKTSTDFV